MDYKRIEILLQKYLEGTSSSSEEKELQAFFAKNNPIPKKLLFAKDIFEHFNGLKSQTYTKPFKAKKQLKRNRYYLLSGIAASLLMGLLLFSPHIKTTDKVIYAYIDGKAITDIAIAEKHTKRILSSASKTIDNGTKSLYKAGKYTNPIIIINN